MVTERILTKAAFLLQLYTCMVFIMTSVAEFCMISQIHIGFYGWISLSKSNARLKISKRLVMFSITETSEMEVKKQNPFLPKTLFWYVHPPQTFCPPPLNYYTTIKCIRTVTLLPLRRQFIALDLMHTIHGYSLIWKVDSLFFKQVTEYVVHYFKQNSVSK